MNDTILEMKGITKKFHGVVALDKVDFKLHRGELHALMGENGAGKSTLMKILMGLHQPDEGTITLSGQSYEVNSPREALHKGISMIHQELSNLPEMTVMENLFLGRENKSRFNPFYSKKDLRTKTNELLDKLRLGIKPDQMMKSLNLGYQQMIEIIKAVSYDSKIVIMDEPTSSLSSEEVERLYEAIDMLKEQGVSIIYISHRMEEIFELADRVTVFRDGQYICSESIDNITHDELITKMVGRKIDSVFPKIDVTIGEPVLEVSNLNRQGVIKDINFTVHKGEILGFSGLVGAGRSEVMRCLYGLDQITTGEITISNEKVIIDSPKDAIKYGIGMVTEDRKELGLVLNRSILENISLSNLHKYDFGPFVKLKEEKVRCTDIAKKLAVKSSGLSQTVESLSGGNQQKVVIAKWIMDRPKILILDEPTRGIDVGAKAEIHRLMSQLAEQGMAIILVSSELPEVLGMSDRILVMGNGQIKGEFSREEATQEKILSIALA